MPGLNSKSGVKEFPFGFRFDVQTNLNYCMKPAWDKLTNPIADIILYIWKWGSKGLEPEGLCLKKKQTQRIILE